MDSKDLKGIGTVASLNSGNITAYFDSFGAKCLDIIIDGENQLFYDEDDIGHSGIPICFPSFGPLRNNEFLHDDQVFPMKQHGFIRDLDFQTSVAEEGSLSYSISQNKETLARYPFDFTFSVTYSLNENGLQIDLAMSNESSEKMPVSPGIHPYFAVNDPSDISFTTEAVQAHNNLNSYEIESLVDSEYLQVEGDKVKVLKNPDHHLIDHQLETTTVSRGAQKTIELTASLDEFKFMTVWRKSEDSKFICLEPANVQNGLNDSPQWIDPGSSFKSTVLIDFK